MKRCVRCKESKDLDDFPTHAGSSDGHRRYCYPCAGRVKGSKVCFKCGLLKSNDYFYKSGKTGRLQGYCKICSNNAVAVYSKTDESTQWVKNYRAKHQDRYRAHARNSKAKVRIERPVLALWRACKRRSQLKSWPFDLTVEDLGTIPEVCPVLGIPIITSRSRADGNSPSLDRIDNNKPYTKDNVAIISYRANVLKNSATLEEVEKIWNYMKIMQNRFR